MKHYLLIAALLLGAAGPGVAAAQDDARPLLVAAQGDEARGGRHVSLSSVLAMIAKRTPGHHLNTTQGEFGGRAAYFVQWQLTNGQVVVFIVDAESGQILGQQGG